MKFPDLHSDLAHKMTYGCRGVILIDIILGLTLATIFITIMSESTFSARKIFEYAKAENIIVNKFKFSPFSDTSSISTIKYGNEQLRQDSYGFSQIIPNSISSPTISLGEIEFVTLTFRHTK